MKTLALIATAGGPLEDNLEILESQVRNPAAMMGCVFLSCVFPSVTAAPGELAKDPGVTERARAFGVTLAA
jgi:hypothetical protein